MPNKEIVKCKVCGEQEYSGMLHWNNGQTMCRKCIYKLWSEGNVNWCPGENDYVFPLYEDGNSYVMHTYYASLVRGLIGYYVKFSAPSEIIVRKHLAKYFGRVWCSTYTADDIPRLKEKYPVNIINEGDPIILMTEEWE